MRLGVVPAEQCVDIKKSMHDCCTVLFLHTIFDLQVYKERVVGYLLELVRALPRAKWVQNTLVSAKRGECWETVTTASSQLPNLLLYAPSNWDEVE